MTEDKELTLNEKLNKIEKEFPEDYATIEKIITVLDQYNVEIDKLNSGINL